MSRISLKVPVAVAALILSGWVLAGAQEHRDSLSVAARDTLSAAGAPAVSGGAPVRDTVYIYLDGKKDMKFSSYTNGKRFLFALRTNIFAVPLVNVGVEFPFGNHWSVGIDYYYPFIKRNTLHKDCFEFIGYDLDVRYYLGSDRYPSQSRLLGHSFGIYGAGGHYDFEREWKGYQGTFFNVGFDWKYSWPIFHGRMHMEIELGLGLIYSDVQPYEVYEPYGDCFRRPAERKIVRWFGPTRAQFTIAVPIYRKPLTYRRTAR